MYISCQNSQMMTTDINRRNKFMFKSGVCKNKSKEQMIRKIIELAFIGLMVFLIIYYPQVAAFADDGEAAVSGAQLVSNSVGKVYDIMAAFVSSIGAIIVLWMLFEMGMAVQSQEGTMQANGIKKVGGGLVMVLAPQLISALI